MDRFVDTQTHLVRDVGFCVGERLGDGDGFSAVTFCGVFLAARRVSKCEHVQSFAYGGASLVPVPHID